MPPKVKPIGDLHSVPHYRCGSCKRAIVIYTNDDKPEICRWCGCLVDWRELKGENNEQKEK